jgi:hypothetical protein
MAKAPVLPTVPWIPALRTPSAAASTIRAAVAEVIVKVVVVILVLCGGGTCDATTVELITTSRKMYSGRSCLQSSLSCDKANPLTASNYSLLFKKQGLVHCNSDSHHSRACLEYYISEENKEFSPEFTPFNKVSHEAASNDLMSGGVEVGELVSSSANTDNHVYYAVPLINHYLSLMKDVGHSIHRINRNANYATKNPAYVTADMVIDIRCYHSWTVNPFHRHADCLTFMLPALYTYLQSDDFDENSQVLREYKEQRDSKATATARRSSSSTGISSNITTVDDLNKLHIMFLVDESSDHICRALSFQKSCVFNIHSVLERKFGSDSFAYSCISTSNYFASPNWFRHKAHISVVAREFIYLLEQQNPFTSASGYHAPGAGVFSPRNPLFATYLAEYRRILFNGYCSYCTSSVAVQENYDFHSTEAHDYILVVLRRPTMSRHIPQMNLLVAHLDAVVGRANKVAEERNQLLPGTAKPYKTYKIEYYQGHETICTTIDKFWRAKVVIAAHGAGIINTIFSRPNSLLIEITPDKIENELHGTPWRTNSYIAESVALSTHVVVVEHDVNATTDRQLQMKSQLNMNGKQIDFVAVVLYKYLTDTVLDGKDHEQTMQTTVMVDS